MPMLIMKAERTIAAIGGQAMEASMIGRDKDLTTMLQPFRLTDGMFPTCMGQY